MSYIYDAGQVSKDSKAMEFSELNNQDHDDQEARVESSGSSCRPHRFSQVKRCIISDVENGLCDSWMLDDLYYDAPVLNEDEQDVFNISDKHDLLSWMVAKISLSPTASAMLNEAMEDGWSLGLEDLGRGNGGPDFHLDVPQKTVILDNGGMLLSALGRSEYFRNALLVSFIRTLRDVWQEKRHGGFDEVYGPEAVLTLQRTRAADLDVISILVAWELRGESFGSLWRHLIGSDDGDLAMRFSGYLERDPSALFNGKALAECFTQWFRDESRIARADHEALNELDGLVADYKEGLSEFGDKALKAIGVEVLSCLPDRTAYLQGMGYEILSNPLYAGLNDPVNQAHFMQLMHDMKVTRVHDVPFRDAELAEKIFPGGQFTPEITILKK